MKNREGRAAENDFTLFFWRGFSTSKDFFVVVFLACPDRNIESKLGRYLCEDTVLRHRVNEVGALIP